MNLGETDFICNLSTCRRQVVNTGWVTSCSHMFCEEDSPGKHRQEGQIKCPVCDTVLENKYDVVHVNLNPSEEYKSMVLAGMRPEVALEIAGRAVSFWAYQMSSERSYQERAGRKVAAHVDHIQNTHQAAMSTLKVELATSHKERKDLEKENEALRMKLQETRDMWADRGRQLQKAQIALSVVRRGNINKSSVSPNSVMSEGVSPSKASSIGRSPDDLFSLEQSRHKSLTTPKKSCNDQGFNFRPMSFPDAGEKTIVSPFKTSQK